MSFARKFMRHQEKLARQSLERQAKAIRARMQQRAKSDQYRKRTELYQAQSHELDQASVTHAV